MLLLRLLLLLLLLSILGDADIPIDGGSVDESYPLTDGLGAAAMPARARYAYASNACQS